MEFADLLGFTHSERLAALSFEKKWKRLFRCR